MFNGACSSAGCLLDDREQFLEIYGFARERSPSINGFGRLLFLFVIGRFHDPGEHVRATLQSENFDRFLEKMLKTVITYFELTSGRQGLTCSASVKCFPFMSRNRERRLPANRKLPASNAVASTTLRPY